MRLGTVSSAARCPSNQGFQGNRVRSTTLRGCGWNAGGAGGDGAVAGDKVQAPGVDGVGRVNADKGRCRGRGKGKKAGGGGVVPPQVKITSLQASTLRPAGGVAAGLVWVVEVLVWLPCTSTKRSQVLPEVTNMRCRLPKERVARTFRKYRCNLWIHRKGNWRHTLVSVAMKTSQFTRRVPSCMLFEMLRRVIRRDTS